MLDQVIGLTAAESPRSVTPAAEMSAEVGLFLAAAVQRIPVLRQRR
jgi:hypothetical protein